MCEENIPSVFFTITMCISTSTHFQQNYITLCGSDMNHEHFKAWTWQNPYPGPVVFQWQSSVPISMCPVYTGMPLDPELLVASVPQWHSSVFQLCKLTLEHHWVMSSSSVVPVAFQCSLGHHWVIASASVLPVAPQCTCGSSGLPVCSNYAN